MQVANHRCRIKRKATLTTITKEILTQTFWGNWFVLLNLSESGKEGKVEGLLRYHRPGIKAVRYTEENGILWMVHESLWRRRQTAGHNMVFRWSLVSLKWLCEIPEYTHMDNRTPSWVSWSSTPFGKDRCVVCYLQLSHNRSNFLPRDFEYCSLSGNLQRICGSTWWWRALKRLFSAGWSHMPHLEWEHGHQDQGRPIFSCGAP